MSCRFREADGFGPLGTVTHEVERGEGVAQAAGGD